MRAPTFVDEPHRQRELGMEAGRAANAQFLGHHHVLRNAHVAAQAQLHDDAARAHHLQPVAQGMLVARAFEHHVEAPLVGRIARHPALSCATLTVPSAPMARAMASGSSTTSVATISAAPCTRAAAIASTPIGPQPDQHALAQQ
ncbi:hypothetical protein ABIC90_003982 [Variovorax boronicumulans]